MPPPRPSRRGHWIAAPLHHPPSSPRHRVLHFDVPLTDGREIISVDPQDGIDVRDLNQSDEEDHVAEPACGQTLQDATSSSSVQMQTQPWQCLSSSPIWAFKRFDWGITFYTRIALNGLFHTYPHVGGPFQSLQEAYSAIDCYLKEHRHPTMFMEQPGVSREDRLVRQHLHWPDGTRKKLLKSQQIDERRDWLRQLLQALVDKYNDYHHLLGDLAYEFKDVVRYQSLLGGYGRSRSYYHINFTMKTKGANDSNCGIEELFFAEVTINLGEHIEMVVSCFGMVKPTDNGECYGCDVKHPKDAAAAAAYYAGQDRPHSLCCLFGNRGWTGRDETLKEEEERVRRFYKNEGTRDLNYEETRDLNYEETRDPNYEETVKEQIKLQLFRPTYRNLATTEVGGVTKGSPF